jgi:hypothetical protein
VILNNFWDIDILGKDIKKRGRFAVDAPSAHG